MNRSKNIFQNVKKESGFTLIELLAATIVVSTIGIIVVSIIVSSLRGSNKTSSISITRQNGTYAIGQISKMLRFATSVDKIDGDTAINCIPNNPAPWPTLQPALTSHSSITFTSTDGGQTTLACIPLSGGANPPLTLSSNSASLLDNTVVQIPPHSCQITCDQTTNSDSLLVGIRFSLNTITPTGNLLPELTASGSAIEFNTSVILRNVGR